MKRRIRFETIQNLIEIGQRRIFVFVERIGRHRRIYHRRIVDQISVDRRIRHRRRIVD